jgi:hypothetical protein
LGWVGCTIGKICFIFDFILHTASTIDACAFNSILPSLSLIDMGYIMLSFEGMWVSMGVMRHPASYPMGTRDSFPGGKAAGA